MQKKNLFFLFPVLLFISDFFIRIKFIKYYEFKHYFFYILSIIFSILTLSLFLSLAKKFQKISKIINVFFAFLYTFIIIFSLGYFYYNNILPNYYTLEYILEEFKSSWTLFKGTVQFQSILLLFLVSIFLYFWFYYSLKFFPKLFTNLKILIPKFLLWFTILLILNNNIRFTDQTMIIDSNLYANVTRYVYNHITGKNFGGSGLLARTPIRLEPADYNKKMTANLLVIVFESLRKQNMSLYGYHRKTTPFLDSIIQKRNNEFFVFQNTFTSSTTTMLAVPGILSGITPYQDPKLLHTMPLIWDYAKLVKKTNFYITSHDLHWYNFDMYYSNEKLDHLWTKSINGLPYYNDFGINDKFTVDHFNDFVTKNMNFFGVLQFNTNHYPYTNNINIWSGEKIDEYDNTIYLQDYYLKKIFENLEKNKLLDNTIIILVGDHGEAFNEHKCIGHMEINYIETISVPLIFFIPQKYQNHINLDNLKENLSKITTNMDVVPTILDIYDFNSKQISEIKSKFETKSLLGNIDDNRIIITMNNNRIARYKVGVSAIDKNYHYFYRINVNPYREEIYSWQNDKLEQNNLINTLPDSIKNYYKNYLKQYEFCRLILENKY